MDQEVKRRGDLVLWSVVAILLAVWLAGAWLTHMAQ